MNSHSFSGNYLVLRAEDVSLLDLLNILLWKGNIAEKAFVEFPTGREENLHRRWLIFLSLLGQKELQFFAQIISKFGSMFENWLNLLSWNRGFCILLFRALRGKVVMPDRRSNKFLSFVGYVDRRVHLDKSINPSDPRYIPMLCAVASKLSYENEAVVETTITDCWKMELLGYYKFWNDFQRKHMIQGFMFRDKTTDPNLIVISFRGTELFDTSSWCTDIDISWYEFPSMGKIHGGFMKALGLLIGQGWPLEIEQEDDHPFAYYTLRERLREIVNEKNRTKFILTGHSLGGALAILFVAVLALHKEEKLLDRIEGVYTFGQPRVGDEEFKNFMKDQLHKHQIKYLRFVYSYDMIPRLPSDDSTFLFKHFGTCLYYNSCYIGKIVDEPPHKNYIPLLGFMPRILNAIWELIRSFILPITKGPDYAETCLLTLVRFVGLLLPGLAAHNLHDYVNVTRLGSPDIYFELEQQQHQER